MYENLANGGKIEYTVFVDMAVCGRRIRCAETADKTEQKGDVILEPINVDFTGGGKRDDGKNGTVADIFIPPEHAGKKIAINVILTVILAAVLYYFMIPALNFKAVELYLYVVFVCMIYLALSVLSTKLFAHPEYGPYVRRRARVPVIVIGILAVVGLVGYLCGATFFRASSYSKLLTVQDGDFAQDVAEVDFSSVPRLDADSARNIATRTLGKISDYVSQFVVSDYSTQINYKGTPARVTSLAYGDIFKWFRNTKEGLPAYIIVDMTTQKGEIVRLENGMRYTPSEHFNRYLLRHLRFRYPTLMFDTPSFEIDENGQPYWIVPVLDKTIGLFGGTDVIGAAVVDAVSGDVQLISTSLTGESKLPTDEFVTDEKWQWIDRVYSVTILDAQYNYYGKLSGGFINSVIGQEGVKITSSGSNYLALNDDVYMYTGVTSITSDQSIIGFVLLNQRTKETKYYSVSGALENAAQNSAQGAVQQYAYKATFPLLLNISSEPTYFMALKDSSEYVKMYAMVNVKQSTIVATGRDLTECTENYAAELKRNGVNLNIDVSEMGDENTATDNTPKTKEVSGAVTELRSVVTGGETYFYIRLDADNTYYKVSVANAEKVVLLNVGSTVTFTVAADASGEIVEVVSMK